MRVLVVDDHPMMRAGLRQIVRQAFPDVEMGEAGSAREALDLIVSSDWDVVLLDIDLPDRSGLDLLKDIHLASPGLPVLIVSGQSEQEYGIQVLKAGAAGFLSKTELPAILAKAIEKVCAHGRFISSALAERLAQAMVAGAGREPHEALSAREFQILVSITAGMSVGEIADQLSLSVKTVSTYRTRLLKKMGMKSNAELMRYGLKHGLTR